MKKLLSSIIGGALGLTLAVGVGIGVAAGNNAEFKQAEAADTLLYTLDGTQTGGSNGYASESSLTQNNVTWGVVGNTTQSPWRIGGKSISNTAREIYTKEKLTSYNITKVTIDVGAASNITVNSLVLKVGTAAKGSQTSTVTGTFKTNSTITFSRPSGADWSNKYFDIVFTVTVSGSDNKFVEFKNAKFYKDSSEKTLTSIEISGSLTKTSYVYGESWSRAGLSVLGHYSDNTSATVTSGITWSYNPGIAINGVNQLTITAQVDNLSATHTETITVNKVASPFINGLEYKMFLNNGTSNYYFTGSMSGYYGATSTDASSAVTVYFQAHDDGQDLYFLNGSTKNYIYPTINDTHINFQYSTTAPTNAWYYNGHTIAYYLSAKDCCYTPGNYGSNTTFNMFASYYSDDYYAQFELVSAFTAEQFATQLLDIITCDGVGESAPTLKYNYTWADLGTLYDQVSDKNTLINATADKDSENVVEQAMARYDLVVSKYGYTNFITGRTISSGANRMVKVNTNNMIAITAIIVVISATAVAAYFILRKKKEA